MSELVIQRGAKQIVAQKTASENTGPSSTGPHKTVPASTRANRDLEIANLKTWNLREPVSRRTYSVIRIQTRSGLVGFGECGRLSFDVVAEASTLVLGHSCTAYEPLAVLLAHLPGIRAAANVALLDIIGKATKAPIYHVLGGPTRYRVRALANLAGNSDQALVGSMQKGLGAGHRAFMIPIPAVAHSNQGQAFIQSTRSRLEALRQAAGNIRDNTDFVVDGGNRLSPGDAQMVSEAIERDHVLWFNEPCTSANVVGLRRLAVENVTPIGVGRHLPDASEIQNLLREEAVDIIRPDIGIHGISAIRRMSALAEAYYVAVGPTHQGGPIGTAAALQLAATIPNFFIQQIPWIESDEDRKMRLEIVRLSIESVQDGFFELPNGVGLGIDVDEAALEKYQEVVR